MALWGNPIEVHYDGLDPSARYTLRVTYGGFRRPATLRLDGGGGLEIHGPLEFPNRSARYDFHIPAAATAAGRLDLVWSLVRREGCLERERDCGGRGLAIAAGSGRSAL